MDSDNTNNISGISNRNKTLMKDIGIVLVVKLSAMHDQDNITIHIFSPGYECKNKYETSSNSVMISKLCLETTYLV